MAVKVYYAIDDAMPIEANGNLLIGLKEGIWYVHPNNEFKLLADAKKHDFEAVKLFSTSGMFFEIEASIIVWPT